mgnify:CR=1 FL=1
MKTLTVAFAMIAVCVVSYAALVQEFSRQQAALNARKATFWHGTIENAIRRLEHLPFVLSSLPEVRAALKRGTGEDLDPLLKSFAARAGADHIFLMRSDGTTIAASNYKTAESFVGRSYEFRPYFTDAMKGQTGHYYAIGVTTGQPGYFVSAPVRDAAERIVGVIVVKIGLGSFNRAWQDTGERILVANEDSVIVLSSDPTYLFRTLHPLPDEVRARLSNTRQFGTRDLQPLDWDEEAGRAVLGGDTYLETRIMLEQEGWTLHLLGSLASIRMRSALIIAGILAMAFAIIIAMTSFRSARYQRALFQANKDRQRLIREIRVRKATEQDLKSTREELERASRLAALGQLSASITHELGQPISAMRNYLAAEEIVSGAPADGLNRRLAELVDRMHAINNQLRLFASPKKEENGQFDLRDALESALELVAHDIVAAGVALKRSGADHTVSVAGSQQRVEQVLTNLLKNALDAVSDSPRRELDVEVGSKGDMGFITVADTGPGLGGRQIEDLQQPFVSTKPSGQGMGLGLTISAQIASDLNGSLQAREREAGGAAFTLWLPLYGRGEE